MTEANDFTPTPPAPHAPPPPSRPRDRRALGAIALLALLALPGYWIFEWFLCRIEVTQGEIVVLVAKTGRDLPSGRIIAGPDEKGIRLDTLAEGRHFRNPLFWDWVREPISEVPPGKVGVLVRLFGKEPEGGRVLVDGPVDGADPEKAEKGILRDVLRPGRYRVNPHAYGLEIFDAVRIESGRVGVVTNLVGPTPKKRNEYVVEPGERGVQRTVLGPGTHYLNPYAVKVDTIDVRERRLEFGVETSDVARLPKGSAEYRDAMRHEAVIFPSSDGFEILVKLAVTWQVDPDAAPLAFVRISTSGDFVHFEEELVNKVLTPVLRGYARIEGSKFEATQYISAPRARRSRRRSSTRSARRASRRGS